MKTKKLLVLFLALVLMLVVVACGSKETEKKGKDNSVQETVQNEEQDDEEQQENTEVIEDEDEKTDTKEDTSEDESAVNIENSNTQSTVEKVTMYAKSSVNVRSGAGTSHAKVGSLSKGQEVVKVGEENGWSKIEFNGMSGYVNSKYLSKEKVSTSTANSKDSNASTNNTPNTGSAAPSTPAHEHTWVTEEKTYTFIKTYVNGCNGCGYPLFTITENGGQHLENLYYHPPYETDRYDEPCTGGGFHNESLTQGYCYFCGDSVVYRQCMWTEMGKRCATCEVLGAYEKYEFNQNHFMYLDTCRCQQNWIIIRSEDGKGLILVKEYCSTCGATKE